MNCRGNQKMCSEAIACRASGVEVGKWGKMFTSKVRNEISMSAVGWELKGQLRKVKLAHQLRKRTARSAVFVWKRLERESY